VVLNKLVLGCIQSLDWIGLDLVQSLTAQMKTAVYIQTVDITKATPVASLFP